MSVPPPGYRSFLRVSDRFKRFIETLWIKAESLPLETLFMPYEVPTPVPVPWYHLPNNLPPREPEVWKMAGVGFGCEPTASQRFAVAVLMLASDWWRGVKKDWQWSRRECGRPCDHPVAALRYWIPGRAIECEKCGRWVCGRSWQMCPRHLITTEADFRAYVIEIFNEFGEVPNDPTWIQ